jgi:hypothetical protein
MQSRGATSRPLGIAYHVEPGDSIWEKVRSDLFASLTPVWPENVCIPTHESNEKALEFSFLHCYTIL